MGGWNLAGGCTQPNSGPSVADIPVVMGPAGWLGEVTQLGQQADLQAGLAESCWPSDSPAGSGFSRLLWALVPTEAQASLCLRRWGDRWPAGHRGLSLIQLEDYFLCFSWASSMLGLHVGLGCRWEPRGALWGQGTQTLKPILPLDVTRALSWRWSWPSPPGSSMTVPHRGQSPARDLGTRAHPTGQCP